MLVSPFTYALRQLQRNRLYAGINIVGLTLGLTVFILTRLIIAYELNHDHMFDKRDRIYTVGSVFSLSSGEPIKEYPNIRLGFGPIFDREIEAVERVVRTAFRRQVIESNQGAFHLGVRFVDPGFEDLFNFHYLFGGPENGDSSGLVITASTALTHFGRHDVVGEYVLLDRRLRIVISGVIADVAADSHFNSSLMPDTTLSAFAPMAALVELGGILPQGEWDTLEPTDITYLLVPDTVDRQALQGLVDKVAMRHMPEHDVGYIEQLVVRPLIEVNTVVWRSLGFPVIETVGLLGVLVLVVASLNYANLATALGFGRTREVGLRKAFGASQGQLLRHFLLESITLVLFAGVLALASVELLLPLYNDWVGRSVELDYLEVVPTLILSCIVTGLLAGTYPAYLISRHKPVAGLRADLLSGRGGSRVRAFLIASQFAISLFIMALVAIIHLQNAKLIELNESYPRTEVVVLSQIEDSRVVPHVGPLRDALTAIDGVTSVSFSSGIPFLQAGGSITVGNVNAAPGPGLELLMVSMDAAYFDTYNIELIAGQMIDFTADKADSRDVVINETAARQLGYSSVDDSIGRVFEAVGEIGSKHRYRVVGAVLQPYFLGVHMKAQAIVFSAGSGRAEFCSVRLNRPIDDEILAQIDAAWSKAVPELPVRRALLSDYFDRFFRIPRLIGQLIGLFAGIAMTLALIGLFGLAAFMAQRRTREIGLRKVMGAERNQLIRLLIWQFTLPVLWSLPIALPVAYWASDIYLDFFAERVQHVLPIIALTSIICLFIAWLVVAAHAISVARARPAQSLRYP